MLELKTTADDDPAFLEIARDLIVGTAQVHGFKELIVTHIDHWFGPRRLGFRGKLFGKVGVQAKVDIPFRVPIMFLFSSLCFIPHI